MRSLDELRKQFLWLRDRLIKIEVIHNEVPEAVRGIPEEESPRTADEEDKARGKDSQVSD